MMKSCKNGFSLIEILVAMIFVSMAFLPIYNLFRFGSQGTVNNVNEITANNYASDLINFVRELNIDTIRSAAGNNRKISLNSDNDIKSFFRRAGVTPPTEANHPFIRSMTLEYFRGRNTLTPSGALAWLLEILNRRRSVPNFLIKVRVEYPRTTGGGKDDVTLFTLVMD